MVPQRTKLIRLSAACAVVCCICLSSCYYDVESELYPGSETCDTTSVSFATDIVPLLELRCNQCHNAADADGGVALEPYNSVLEYVNDGTLICTVRWDAGCSEMPKNAAKLPACEILTLERWILDGALEN